MAQGDGLLTAAQIEEAMIAGSAMRMGSDAAAQAMGRFDDRADFVLGELLVESSLDVGEHAAGSGAPPGDIRRRRGNSLG